LILKANEETLLSMPFEHLLQKITHIATQYIINHEHEDNSFDLEFKSLKVPSILLERLSREFDESLSASKL
jgi:hypothetical protein